MILWSCQIGWKVSVNCRLRASSFRAAHRESELCPEATPALSWLPASDPCCVERWTVAPSQVMCCLEQLFFGNIFVISSIQPFHRVWPSFPSLLLRSTSAAWCCHHHASPQHWFQPGVAVSGVCETYVWSSAQKYSISFFALALRAFKCSLANSRQAVVYAFYSKWRPWSPSTIKACLMECCSHRGPSGRFSHFCRGLLKLCWMPRSPTSHLRVQLLRSARRPTQLVLPNFFHFTLLRPLSS